MGATLYLFCHRQCLHTGTISITCAHSSVTRVPHSLVYAVYAHVGPHSREYSAVYSYRRTCRAYNRVSTELCTATGARTYICRMCAVLTQQRLQPRLCQSLNFAQG